MARAGRYSFVIEQGATFTRQVQYLDSSNDPVNLTNYGARLYIRQSYDSAVTIIKLTTTVAADGTGISIMSPAASGTINITISAYSSSLLSFNEAVYDLEIYSGSGVSQNVKRLLEGKVKLSREVTR